MIVLNSLFPVIMLIISGGLLRRFGFTNTSFLQTSDKLIYFIFFPAMLFWKIGSSTYGEGFSWDLCFSSLLALLVMFVLSIIFIYFFKISAYQAGSFAQSCYRFNTYIGVAIILNSLGSEGIKYFGVLIGVVIPIINVAAVTTLLWFSQEDEVNPKSYAIVVKALLSNPLILGCLAGLFYSRVFTGFPQFLDNTLGLISMVTLPMALISIGGTLNFAGLRKHLPLSLAAAVIKLIVFPVVGYCCLRLFGVTGVPFMVGMIFFALPTSTAIYVLSSQMHSDPELATSAIVVSTVLSFPVLTLVLYFSFS